MPLASDMLFRLKAATRDLIERVGGLDRAGRVAGYSTSSMHRYGSTTHTDMLPIAAILLLERDCGVATISGLLTELQADLPGEPPPSFGRANAFLARALAELQATIAEAQADAAITPNEAASIERNCAAVHQALSTFRGSNAKAVTATAKRGSLVSGVLFRHGLACGDRAAARGLSDPATGRALGGAAPEWPGRVDRGVPALLDEHQRRIHEAFFLSAEQLDLHRLRAGRGRARPHLDARRVEPHRGDRLAAADGGAPRAGAGRP